MDTAQLNQIINSILSTIPNANPSDKQNDDGSESVQYLLPVDLLVSVNKKTNEKKMKAAIPPSQTQTHQTNKTTMDQNLSS